MYVQIQSKWIFEKMDLKFWVRSGVLGVGIGIGWVVWGMGKGGRWEGRNFSVIRKREIFIVKRQNDVLMKGLRENNSTIITDSSVECLEKLNLNVF